MAGNNNKVIYFVKRKNPFALNAGVQEQDAPCHWQKGNRPKCPHFQSSNIQGADEEIR